MLTTKLLVTALFCLAANIDLSSAKFRVIREWSYVNFTWPSAEIYNAAFEGQQYVPENNIIAGLKYFEEFYYITLPRMKSGVPATLVRVPAGLTNDTAPLLSPYPSWEMNKVGDCNALQNVQNIEIDPNLGQIWIIDGGRTETLSSSPVAKCKPKLQVYDIRKETFVLSYVFPEDVAGFNGSFLYDIVLDNTDQGYAYITDNSGRDPGIIVFSVKDHKAWKIRHSESMRADPRASFFRVNDVSISASLNIASLALSPRIKNSDEKIIVNAEREVFYSPLSSLHLYSINSSVLRNEQFAANFGEFQGNVKDYGTKASQSVGMVMDNQGVLYYSLLALNGIARWDSGSPFQTGQRIIAKDERYLEWVNSFAFDDKGNLTILVNRLNRFIYQKLNTNEANFRLIASNVGGKSYLYDESYNYESSQSTETSSTNTSEKQVPVLKPGTDQDPNLSPKPEPTLQPSLVQSNSSTTQKPSSGASERAATALISLLTAGMLLVV